MKEAEQFISQETPHLFDFDQNMNLSTLLGKEFIDNTLHKISAATGFAASIVDYLGNPVSNLVNFCSFCKVMQKEFDCSKKFQKLNRFGLSESLSIEENNISIYTYKCPYDLLMCSIPIIVNGHCLGAFVGGQVLCDDTPPQIMSLKHISPPIDYDKVDILRKHYEEIPRYSYSRFAEIMELITFIINQLTEKATDNLNKIRNSYKQNILQLETQKRIEIEQRLTQFTITALRAQMTPRFLLSTLTAISNLAALENAIQTNEVIVSFSDLLSKSLSSYSNMVSIEEEMNTIEQYLSIQKARLGEKLTYTIYIPDALRHQLILNLLILPFVEQSIYFGIELKQSNGTIAITAEYQQDDVVIHIADDGPGLKKSEIESKFIQYKQESTLDMPIDTIQDIIHQRMKASFGNTYSIKTVSTPSKGTIQTIRYPRILDERMNLDVQCTNSR